MLLSYRDQGDEIYSKKFQPQRSASDIISQFLPGGGGEEGTASRVASSWGGALKSAVLSHLLGPSFLSGNRISMREGGGSNAARNGF